MAVLLRGPTEDHVGITRQNCLPQFLKHLAFILQRRSRGTASSGPGKGGRCFLSPQVREVPTSQGATQLSQIFAGAGGQEGKGKDEESVSAQFQKYS